MRRHPPIQKSRRMIAEAEPFHNGGSHSTFDYLDSAKRAHSSTFFPATERLDLLSSQDPSLCIRTSARAALGTSLWCRCYLLSRWQCCVRRKIPRAGGRPRRTSSTLRAYLAVGCAPYRSPHRPDRCRSVEDLLRKRCPTPSLNPVSFSQ